MSSEDPEWLEDILINLPDKIHTNQLTALVLCICRHYLNPSEVVSLAQDALALAIYQEHEYRLNEFLPNPDDSIH